MSKPDLIPSDIIGLHKAPSVSRRSFFMTASAAAAAGYTLAAGPVRAEAITTDAKGIKTGDGKVKVSGGEMPVYFARPDGVKNPPVILVAMEVFGLHEYIKDVTRRLAKAGAFAVAPDYYFRSGQDLTKITEIPKLMPIVNAKRMRNCSPTSTRRRPGRKRRAATPAVSASSAFAGAGARCGNTRRTAAR